MKTITVDNTYELAQICAGLEREGIAFHAYKRDTRWVIEITGH